MLPTSASFPAVKPMYKAVVLTLVTAGKIKAPAMRSSAELFSQFVFWDTGPPTAATRLMGAVAGCCATAVLARHAKAIADISNLSVANLVRVFMALARFQPPLRP